MKKLSIAMIFFLPFIGLGSASATIGGGAAPSPVYVGQPWYVNVSYVADTSLCDPTACPDGHAYAVITGDLGPGSNCQTSCSTPCLGTFVPGGLPLVAEGLIYNTPGTRTLTASVISCIPPDAPPGSGPGGMVLGSWSGTVTVLPQPAQPPAPTAPNPCTANQPVLIDPVAANLVMSGAIVDNNTQLASASTFVQGAAADGVTQLLLRIPASNPGDSLTVQVLNENNQLDQTPNIGGLFAVGDVPGNAANTLSVTAAWERTKRCIPAGTAG